MPNPFSVIDRLELDFDFPPMPSPIERADRWFNRLSEIQRIGVAFMLMLFLAASAFYCIGLGSTVLVNRAEVELAAQQAAFEASIPTAVPTATPLEPTLVPTNAPTQSAPTPRPTTRPTQVVEFPTPIPAQLLPTVPLQPIQQRPAAAVENARPRIVAPYEPPTPTPPGRAAAPASTRAVTTGGAQAPAGTPGRFSGTPTPVLAAPSVFRTPTPATAAKPAATSAPAAKPTSGSTTAPKPTAGSIFQNPISTPATKPSGTSVPKPSTR